MLLRLGQRDQASANAILGNLFVLNLILGCLYTFLVLLFLDPILLFFGASSETLPYARKYMQIISAGNVVTHMDLGLNALLRARGHESMPPSYSLMPSRWSIKAYSIAISFMRWKRPEDPPWKILPALQGLSHRQGSPQG